MLSRNNKTSQQELASLTCLLHYPSNNLHWERVRFHWYHHKWDLILMCLGTKFDSLQNERHFGYIIMSTKLFLFKTRFANKIGWRNSVQFASILSLLEISGIVHAHHNLQLKHQVLCMRGHTPCYRLGLKYGTQNIISMMYVLCNCIGWEPEVDNQSTHQLELFIPNHARIILMYFFLRCNLFNFCLHVFPWQGFLSQQPIHSFWTLC